VSLIHKIYSFSFYNVTCYVQSHVMYSHVLRTVSHVMYTVTCYVQCHMLCT